MTRQEQVEAILVRHLGDPEAEPGHDEIYYAADEIAAIISEPETQPMIMRWIAAAAELHTAKLEEWETAPLLHAMAVTLDDCFGQ